MKKSRRRNTPPARRWLAYAVVVLVTLVAYARVPGFDFVLVDDPEYVASNPKVLAGVSLQLDATIGGRSPGVYHTTNLLLHVAAAWLLLALLERTTGARWRAVYAIHPLHVESVAWIAERKDVLIAALGLYVLGLLAKPMLVTWLLVMLLLDVGPLSRTGTGAGGSNATPRRIGRLIAEKLPFAALAAAPQLRR